MIVNESLWAIAHELGEEFENEMRKRFSPGMRVNYWVIFRMMYEFLIVAVASGRVKVEVPK